jgi:hypothetical protein
LKINEFKKNEKLIEMEAFMIKNHSILTIVLLAVIISDVYGIENGIRFVGYSDQIPVFISLSDGPNGYIPNGRVYKYTDGSLTEIYYHQDFNLLSIKDNIYVFYNKRENDMIEFQIKLKGTELISKFIVKLKFDAWIPHATIDVENLYVMISGKKIVRIKYRNTISLDTLNIDALVMDVISATDNYLYYTVIDKKSVEPNGFIYQMNLKNNSKKMLLGNTSVHRDEIMVIPHLNLVCDLNDFRPVVVDYNKNVHFIPSNVMTLEGNSGIFYLYEHNAFVFYNYSMDINNWQCLSLNEPIKWKSHTDPLSIDFYKEFRAPTGPNVVPFKR